MEEKEQDGDDDDDDSEEEQDQSLAATVVKNVNEIISFEKPERKKVKTPPFDQRREEYTIQFAKSFLFQQSKHNKQILNREIDLGGSIYSSSRNVERAFAISKTLLERNVNTRSEILQAILLLRDFDIEDLWNNLEMYSNKKRIFSQSPKKVEIDFSYWKKLQDEAHEFERKYFETLKQNDLKKYLIEAKVMEKNESITKKHLIQFLFKNGSKYPTSTKKSCLEEAAKNIIGTTLSLSNHNKQNTN